jgi:hypothetical protein
MKFKSLLVGISAILLLAACNSGGGGTTGSDVQSATVNYSNIVNMSTTATGCKSISANGGTCTLAVTYSAPSGSNSIGQFLQLTLPTNYSSNIVNQCSSGAGAISTTAKSCTITITSQSGANTGSAQSASIYPANAASSSITFIVGGGV